ncbi:hypothetical protein BJ912DRAFT_936353 [Pholiota molesta]|nr:hypothetical protein BJ912DRAFT_936353 [Pholiota molesta]
MSQRLWPLQKSGRKTSKKKFALRVLVNQFFSPVLSFWLNFFGQIFGQSQVTMKLATFKIASNWSQVTPLAESTEILQYLIFMHMCGSIDFVCFYVIISVLEMSNVEEVGAEFWAMFIVEGMVGRRWDHVIVHMVLAVDKASVMPLRSLLAIINFWFGRRGRGIVKEFKGFRKEVIGNGRILEDSAVNIIIQAKAAPSNDRVPSSGIFVFDVAVNHRACLRIITNIDRDLQTIGLVVPVVNQCSNQWFQWLTNGQPMVPVASGFSGLTTGSTDQPLVPVVPH